MPSLEGLTGYIVFETHGGSRLSDYWQQKTETSLSRVHVTPRKTLFTPSHAPVDLSLLSPSRTTGRATLMVAPRLSGTHGLPVLRVGILKSG